MLCWLPKGLRGLLDSNVGQTRSKQAGGLRECRPTDQHATARPCQRSCQRSDLLGAPSRLKEFLKESLETSPWEGVREDDIIHHPASLSYLRVDLQLPSQFGANPTEGLAPGLWTVQYSPKCLSHVQPLPQARLKTRQGNAVPSFWASKSAKIGKFRFWPPTQATAWGR